MNEVWKTAAFRAGLSAALLGTASFLGVWATTDEVKTLVIAFGTPFVGTLVTRLGVEGAVDSKKS